jgi:hypothetical protein
MTEDDLRTWNMSLIKISVCYWCYILCCVEWSTHNYTIRIRIIHWQFCYSGRVQGSDLRSRVSDLLTSLDKPNNEEIRVVWLLSTDVEHLKHLRSYLNGKVAAPGLENRDYDRGDPLRWPRDTLYQLKLALTSPTGCGRSVGIVRLRTKTTEFSSF